MSRWRKDVALTAEDLENSVALAVEIKGLADALYAAGVDDPRLLRIRTQAEAIRAAIARVNTRLYGQGNLFGTGDEEPVASRRAEFSPQGRGDG